MPNKRRIFIYHHNQWMYRLWSLVSLVYYLTENTRFPSVLTFAIAKLLSESLCFTLKSIHDKLLRYSGLRQSWGQNTDIDTSRPVSAFFSSAGKVCFELFMRVVSQRYDYGFLVGGLVLRKHVTNMLLKLLWFLCYFSLIARKILVPQIYLLNFLNWY